MPNNPNLNHDFQYSFLFFKGEILVLNTLNKTCSDFISPLIFCSCINSPNSHLHDYETWVSTHLFVISICNLLSQPCAAFMTVLVLSESTFSISNILQFLCHLSAISTIYYFPYCWSTCLLTSLPFSLVVLMSYML